MNFFKKNFWFITNIFALLAYLSVANYIRLKDPKPLIKDSEEYVILSHNLAFRGIFSYDGISYTNLREPVSSFLNAVNFRLFTNIDQGTSLEDMISKPELITQLTQINIFYLLLFFLALWWLTYLMTGTHGWVIATTFLPMSFFSIGTTYTQRLLSDLPSIILLMVSVSLVLTIYRKPIFRNSILLALVLAALILSKGVFYYLVPVYILFLGFLFWFKEKDIYRVSRVRYLVFGLSGSLLLLLPWMIRNKIHFDDYSLTKRGGTILMIRAEKNQMNQEEFKGAFYFYSPDVLKRKVFEKWLGYKESDYWDGGILQRLNRDLENDYSAIEEGDFQKIKSFLRRTMYVTIPELQSEARDKGIDPDKYLKAKALELIFDDPHRHLQTSLVFAWRGLWFYQGDHLTYVILIILSYLSFFFLFGSSLFNLNSELISVLAFPFLIFLFHSLLSHNIPRYCLPFLPFISLCLILVFKKVLFNKKSNNASGFYE